MKQTIINVLAVLCFVLLVLGLSSDQTGRVPIPVIITSPLESNGAVPSNIQDQHSQMFDILFEQTTNTTTLYAQASKGDRTIEVTSTTGFTTGKQVILLAADGVVIVEQIGAPSGTTITIDSPLPYDIANGVTVFTAFTNMAVDGSSTAQSFKIGPIGNQSVDVTRILGVIQDNAAMDDAKFGGITALTNGIVFRHYDASTDMFVNFWNVKENGDFALLCFDATYTDPSPAGVYGLRFRNSFAGQEKHGVTIRLDAGDYLEILIQDNLTTLLTFYIMMQGHLIQD